MEKLKSDELYEIEGKIYKLCKLEWGMAKRFYFKQPTFEDAKQDESRKTS